MRNDLLSTGERFFKEERTVTFRKEDFTYEHTCIIDANGEMWTTTELDEVNLTQVYNQYRAKHGIPFPDEIIGLRKHYGITAEEMSRIIGLDINQYLMYERDEVPTLDSAIRIIAAKEKKVFLSFINDSRADLTEQEYLSIREKAEVADGDFAMRN